MVNEGNRAGDTTTTENIMKTAAQIDRELAELEAAEELPTRNPTASPTLRLIQRPTIRTGCRAVKANGEQCGEEAFTVADTYLCTHHHGYRRTARDQNWDDLPLRYIVLWEAPAWTAARTDGRCSAWTIRDLPCRAKATTTDKDGRPVCNRHRNASRAADTIRSGRIRRRPIG